MNPKTTRRMPAEWESPKRILLTYPSDSTDWNYILDEARLQFDEILKALIKGRETIRLITKNDITPSVKEAIENNEGEIISDIEYNDTWTRDYGAITVEEKGELLELDFGFNGWGLKFASDKDNLINLNLLEKGYGSIDSYRNHRDFTLEGGSIETNGKGTILTTARCLCSANRNGGKSTAEIEDILKRILGARRILWLFNGYLEGDDTDSHIDTLARMAPEDTILYVDAPSDTDDPHYKEMAAMREELKAFRTEDGRPYRLIPLPFPNPIYDDSGERLPATYANYLVTGWNLYLPTYGQPDKDSEARKAVQLAFPNHTIFTVDCRTLIRQHGSLHCSTMQLYI